MIEYRVPGTRSQLLQFRWGKNGPNQMGLFVYQGTWTGESYLVEDRITSASFEDKKWHHMCVTFSGESGVISQYLDGIRAKSETGIAQEFDGGGTLTIGETFKAQSYQITGFNLWDKILPAAEIKELATSCLKGIGNVKHWLEFSDKAKAISNLKVNAPSICLPPAQRAPVEEPTESSSQKDG
ncbi:hypothetical protein ACROYT_G001592 [Oculina patagonica]